MVAPNEPATFQSPNERLIPLRYELINPNMANSRPFNVNVMSFAMFHTFSLIRSKKKIPMSHHRIVN